MGAYSSSKKFDEGIAIRRLISLTEKRMQPTGKDRMKILNPPSYEGHFLICELDYDEQKIFSIKNNFSIRFSYTCCFIHASLGMLATNLNKLKYISEIFCEKMNLVSRKGVYPYDYTNSIDSILPPLPPPPAIGLSNSLLEETSLLERENFYNQLTDKHISDEDYEHAKNVWKSFKCRTLCHYSDVYLKSDVTLLAYVFENIQDVFFGAYKLEPAWYYTAPGLTFDAMLKLTEIELELLMDYDMILMIEKGICGKISQCSKRYCKANNKYLENYNHKIESNYITYYDANNLYGWVLSDQLMIKNIPDHNEEVYIFEVDLDYPQTTHDEHSDLSLCPENKINNNKHIKLLTMLENKEKYVIHYVNLKQAISLGLLFKKIHRVIEFDQSPWLKSYIDLNNNRRMLAKNEFEKDFYKLINNVVFGNTMENVRKSGHDGISGQESKNIHDQNEQTNIYIGFCILDLSKMLMYDFHYRSMLPKYEKKLSLAYIDTDSLIYSIKTNDINDGMLENLDVFDTSNYPKDHLCYSVNNKKVIGKFKDECDRQSVTHIVGLHARNSDEELIADLPDPFPPVLQDGRGFCHHVRPGVQPPPPFTQGHAEGEQEAAPGTLRQKLRPDARV
ncbi:hypothetical protein J437_LFUL008269, partial [Ladona fulva]